MRIAYVLTSLGVGGAEREALTLAGRMSQRGHAVALLVLRSKLAQEWPAPFVVFHLNLRKNPASICAGLFGARRFLRGFRPDIVHSHSFHANMMARLLKLTMRGPVVLSTVHNVFEGGRPRMLAYRATDGLSRRTTAVSEAVARRFMELKAVGREKCMVIPNAIEIAELSPDTQRRRSRRAAMNAGESFIWLAAGRVAPAKNYSALLHAFVRLRAERNDAQLWIAGEAQEEESARLRALASQLGLENSIRWLGLRRDLPALLDAADAFVLSSAWEGMPLVIAEAMAMEKLVVATDVGGVRELVGETACVVPRSDPDALAAGMLEVMRQPARWRQARGSAARQRILANFAMDTRAEEWEMIYRRLLD